MGFFDRLFGSKTSSRASRPSASPAQQPSRTASSTSAANNNLLLAIHQSDTAAAAMQLGRGANANALISNGTVDFTPLTFYFNGRLDEQAHCPEIVELLLDRGADANKTDSSGVPPLGFALNQENGHLLGIGEVLELLLEHGADVNAASPRGATPLCCAAELGSVELVDTLLAAGADPNAPGVDGWTPLHAALSVPGDDTAVAPSLIDAGADVNFVNNTQGRSILVVAAKMGKVNFVKLLIECGVDISWTVEGLNTALTQAVLDNQVAVAQTLLEHGALRFEPRPSFLLVAAAKSDRLTDLLVQHGVRPEEGMSRDDYKARQLRTEAIHEVFEELRGTDEDSAEMTPLFAASYSGDVSAVKSLLDQGANPDAKSFVNYDLNRMFDPGLPKEVGVTIFALARRKAHEPGLFMRMEMGIPNLYYPCLFGHCEVAELLLRAGANPNRIMFNGLFPLYAAAEMGHLRIVGALIDSGTDVNLATPMGATALRNAAEEGHYEVVRLLLDHGASANQRNNDADGTTALGAALHFGHPDIARLLREHGAVH